MESHQTADLEAQKSPEIKGENSQVKDDAPDAIATGEASNIPLQSSMDAESKGPVSASKPDTENANTSDADNGGMSQAYEGDSFFIETGFSTHNQPIIFFEAVARINITILQNELGQVMKNIDAKFSSQDKTQYARRFEDRLHRYTTAIRDYEYMNGLDDHPHALDHILWLQGFFTSSYPNRNRMSKLLANRQITPKILPKQSIAPSDPLRRWLRKVLPGSLTWTDEELFREYPGILGGDHSVRTADRLRKHQKPVVISPFVDRLARFIVAITGDLSLVVPMLIMRIHQNPNKSLITTSVAVVLFAGVVSVVFSASNAETLGITAAYAAVLVVFVGTSA